MKLQASSVSVQASLCQTGRKPEDRVFHDAAYINHIMRDLSWGF